MSLSGSSLVVALAALTVGLPLLAVLLWPRLHGPRPLVLPARLLMVLAGQLAAVLLVGAVLNDYAYFFGSWSDLWASVRQGIGTHYRTTPVTYHRNGRAGSGPAPGITVIGARPRSVADGWSRSGRLEKVRIRGAASQLGTKAYVYLPPQYFEPRYAHTRFPAVEVLGGYPSTDAMLVRRLAFQRRLLREIDARRAGPMVLVLMRPTVTFPRDTECTDVPGGPQVETFYAQDVPAQVSRTYRVLDSPWGIAGVSTGGYCATKIAMTYPTRFTAAVSLSGYYQALRDYTTGDLWGGSAVLRALNSPEWRLRHQPAPPVSLLLTSSRDEAGPLGYRDTRRFLSLVRPPMRVSSIIAPHGGHLFTTWKPEIPAVLRWLSARLSGAPAATAVPGTRLSAGPALAAPPPAASGRSAGGPRRPGGPRRAPAAR